MSAHYPKSYTPAVNKSVFDKNEEIALIPGDFNVSTFSPFVNKLFTQGAPQVIAISPDSDKTVLDADVIKQFTSAEDVRIKRANGEDDKWLPTPQGFRFQVVKRHYGVPGDVDFVYELVASKLVFTCGGKDNSKIFVQPVGGNFKISLSEPNSDYEVLHSDMTEALYGLFSMIIG